MFASGPSTTAARQCVRSFSTTRLCRSKIGSAPLSLPQEVKFSILPQTVVKTGRGVSRDGQGSMVEISGPLGTMKMDIPAYVSIEANEENRTRTLSILDANDRKQREMWGELVLFARDARACARKESGVLTDLKRNRQSIPRKSHSRSE